MRLLTAALLLVLSLPVTAADYAAISQAAQAGDANAAWRLGLMLRNGTDAPRDSAAAVRWLHTAAQGGVPAAMFVYANMLLEGEGTPADPAAARRWLERAAEREYPAAMQQVAMGLRDGSMGFIVDPERADILMKESAHALRHTR